MNLFKKLKDNTTPKRRLDLDMDSFKRNQTIVGDVSLVSTRQKTHHLTIKRRKVLAIFSIVILIAMALLLLINNITSKVAVNISSSVSQSKYVDRSIYEKAIQEYLDSNPLGRLMPLLDQNALRLFLINKLPEISDIKQGGKDSLGVTTFYVKMRTPVAGWMINNKQYFVDASGVSFSMNYFDNPSVQIVDQSGISLQSGEVIASQRFLSFVGLVVAQAKDSGYTVTQAIMPLNTTRQLDLKIKEGDYLVKLSIDRSVGEQVEDMSVALKYFASKNQKPEYIDVRVSGKAFYK